MNNSASRRILAFLIIAMVFPALACNMPTPSQEPGGLFENTRTPISTFTLAPSPTRLQPTNTFPPSTATPGPTPTYAPGFNESFDGDWSAWNDLFVLTTQAAGGRIQTTASIKNGLLTFNLADKETYLYRFHKNPQQADLSVEIQYSMEGQKDNQVALVCRAAEDQSRWYEARISGTGVFEIYYYSKARKIQEDLNPFIPLLQGAADAAAFEAGQMNRVRFTCQGIKLKLDFNQGKQVFEVEDDRITGGGLAGFGTMTYANPPAVVQITEVNAAVP